MKRLYDFKYGIYKIINIINKKTYIGSTAQQGFTKRKCNHFDSLRHNQHENPKLQNAWNKYGAENFVFDILLVCDPENCLFYEQIYLDFYKPEYNICKIAGSSIGVKRSQQAKEKIRQCRLAQSCPRTGKHQSIESRKRIALGAAHKLNIEKVYLIRERVKQGFSNKEIASEFLVSPTTISDIKARRTWNLF